MKMEMDLRKESVMTGTEYDNQQEAPRQEAYQQQVPPAAPVYAQAPQAPRSRKSPALATILSMMPGLGQIYVGYYQQGFINALVMASVITLLASGSAPGMEPFAGIFLGFFWIYNMIDANRRAAHFNRVQDGFEGEIPPEDFKDPGANGSIIGGGILVLMGTLFFLDLRFGISLEWIEDWWPLALVAVGAYLIMKAVRKND
jgi:hypothetical protein